ncbi:AcvB/VirJ family lysyl-phosphatidylglycerol hydrolase [Sphingomonas endophytica]|uniref:AcvB/VirJ family lysyl-phosphatidylglycerol hydrolase n=1 Tax=Sphingomonas endophytica TaxID=869719 RepID=UPI0007378A5A|nr:AcvB/VirJ family lysyl-phosphatidylglycerol hydrolase [Sphingomonas endophytica]
MIIAPNARRNPLAIVAGAITAAVLLLLGFVGFLGYFGGRIYRVDPATAPTPVGQAGTVAVFMSGDMGINAGMGPRLIGSLNAHGMTVLSFNSLAAFGQRRTPEDIDRIVADTVARALRMRGARRVVLIGQSFGADMLQYGAASLPVALRPHVAGIVLLVPGSTLLFKVSPGGVLDGAPDESAIPSARRIDWVQLTCIHGEEEEHSLCPSLTGSNVRSVTLPGGHFLGYDIPLISKTLWASVVNGR